MRLLRSYVLWPASDFRYLLRRCIMRWVTARVIPFSRLRQLFWDVPRAFNWSLDFLHTGTSNFNACLDRGYFGSMASGFEMPADTLEKATTRPIQCQKLREVMTMMLEVMDGRLSSRSTNAYRRRHQRSLGQTIPGYQFNHYCMIEHIERRLAVTQSC